MCCYSNREDELTVLAPGVHGLSNHLLNSPWPKVTRGVDAIEHHFERGDDPDLMTERFFELLRDAYVPDDAALPDTGVGVERERELAPMFVHGDVYGTRSSTVLAISGEGDMRIEERSFDSKARETGRVAYSWRRGDASGAQRVPVGAIPV